MGIPIEELVSCSFDNLCSDPSHYLIILSNGNTSVMERFYSLFKDRLRQSSKRFSLEKINNPDGQTEELSRKKEKDSSLIFVVYDPESNFYNSQTERIRRISFSIDLYKCNNSFKRRI